MGLSGRFLFGIAATLCATQALCQDDRPVQWHLQAGYSIAEGTTADFLEDGWTLGTGVTWRQSGSPFAIRGELQYSDYEATNKLIELAGASTNQVRIDDGEGTVWGLNLNGVYNLGSGGGGVRGYVTAGIGAHYREVEMTQTALFSGIICDPWWGFCYEDVFVGDQIVADQSTTRLAWNAGFGVEFPLSGGSSWFIDARYQRIETEEPTEFIPIQIGFRF